MNVFMTISAALLGALVGIAADYAVYRYTYENGSPEKPYDLAGIKTPAALIRVCASAGIFLVMYLKYGISAELPFALFLTAILIAVFFIDLKLRIIPNGLVLAGIAGGICAFACNIFRPLSFMEGGEWWNPLLGMAIGSGFLFIVALIGLLIYGGDGAMGMGDVKIFAVIGLFLGWKMTIAALFITILIGGLTSVILIVTKIRGRKDAIPFGPFIVIGTMIILLFGNRILNLYLSGF